MTEEFVIRGKWPQMLVTGKPVTVEQAEDIILRTDEFLTDEGYSGNNREWIRWYRNESGISKVYRDWDEPGGVASVLSLRNAVRDRLGFIRTTFVENRWASTGFVGGPHGWCSPRGKIQFLDNVGKWPETEDLIRDWEHLAEAFPYLDLHVCFVDEYDDDNDNEVRVPAFNIRVKDGAATPCKVDLSHFKKRKRDWRYEKKMWRKRAIASYCAYGEPSAEQGIPEDMMERIAARVRKAVEEVTS